MIDFTQVEQAVAELKIQLAHHQLDERNFEKQLLELVDLAEDGHYWMFGHESKRWFRHNGDDWVPANPAQILSLRANPASFESGLLADQSPPGWGWFTAALSVLLAIGAAVYAFGLG